MFTKIVLNGIDYNDRTRVWFYTPLKELEDFEDDMLVKAVELLESSDFTQYSFGLQETNLLIFCTCEADKATIKKNNLREGKPLYKYTKIAMDYSSLNFFIERHKNFTVKLDAGGVYLTPCDGKDKLDQQGLKKERTLARHRLDLSLQTKRAEASNRAKEAGKLKEPKVIY